ncbi:MAG: hypothetical protein ABIH00_07210 [Armatimonadota bacterium]
MEEKRIEVKEENKQAEEPKVKPIQISEGTKMPLLFQLLIGLLFCFAIWNLVWSIIIFVGVFILKNIVSGMKVETIIGMAWSIFYLIVITYIWKGYKWARIVFLVLGTLSIIPQIVYCIHDLSKVFI